MGRGKSHNYNNLQDTDLHMMNSNYLGFVDLNAVNRLKTGTEDLGRLR